VILLQLMIGGLLMVSLGIIGTYIARIYEEVKARPRYVVQETRRPGAPEQPA
jgi:dolichol-phosphate mannosyltransferase